MIAPLTLSTLSGLLLDAVERLRRSQIPDSAEPGAGAVVLSDDGRPSPQATTQLITAGGYWTLLQGRVIPDVVEALSRAADALLAMQRDTGLVDLPNVNIDSGPDTGFIVQHLCALLEIGAGRFPDDPAWSAFLDRVATFVRRAVPGMAAGGFHTPNHRWVIAAALVQAQALFPDLEAEPAIRAYLAEGIDVDAEGFYIERSVGTYDAVNNRSWLLILVHQGLAVQGLAVRGAASDREALDAVARNLALDLHLLHADGTAETGLSHRQDYGTRAVPTGLIPCYLLFDHLRPTPAFAAAAQALWRRAGPPQDLGWIAYALLKAGEPGAEPAALPGDYVRHLPQNGLWRLRRGGVSASAFAAGTRLLSFSFGSAMLAGLRIDLTYFGGACGHFIGDTLTADGDEVVLRSEGCGRPRRPGYELPLGRPIAPEDWEASMEARELHRLPPLTATLTLREIAGGLALRYRTLDGMPGVAAQIVLDFEPGGIWETADSRLMPQPGQVVFLKAGWGEMRYGTDVIRVEGGAHAHSMWAMRESQPPGSFVRVLLTFSTPVDHALRLVGFSAPDAAPRRG